MESDLNWNAGYVSSSAADYSLKHVQEKGEVQGVK